MLFFLYIYIFLLFFYFYFLFLIYLSVTSESSDHSVHPPPLSAGGVGGLNLLPNFQKGGA